jgi:hypothetical protein
LSAEDVSQRVDKTWELTSEIIKKTDVWSLAAKKGKDFICFLKAFHAMRQGFKSRSFVYGIIAAEKV